MHASCHGHFVSALTWGVLLTVTGSGFAQQSDAPADIRRTPTVAAIEKATPAVAAIYAFDNSGRGLGTGSASVIDPRGYILTAKHVVKQNHVVLLGGRPPLRASVIGTMPEFDVAILKLGKQALSRPGAPTYPTSNSPPNFIELGIDSEVRVGETILNIGSPGSRGIVATQGIVSAVAFTGINPLSLAAQSATAFDELLQFDAASNPGNSGGPIVNLLGQQIGMAVSGVASEEGIHFAVPLKTIRYSIPVILNSELRNRYVSGIEVDPQRSQTIVDRIVDQSPAAAAGIRVGDRIVSVDARSLRDVIDWEFTKFQWHAGDKVSLGIERDSQELSIELTLAARQRIASVSDENAQPGLECRWATYDPKLPKPIDDDIQPAGEPSIVASVSPKNDAVTAEDHYELYFTGFLKIQSPGVYRLGLRSDDGSRMYLHDKRLIDNGGNHAAILRTSWVDLDAGMHPIRIEYYEDEGNQELEFLIAKENAPLKPVAASELFH